MNLNPLKYLRNTVMPFDRLRHFSKDDRPKIGWCGIFPPYRNGAATVSYYFVRELLKRKDIEVGLIPLNNKIDKSLFKGVVFCRLDDSSLDAVVFWCLDKDFERYTSQIKTKRVKRIVWQTVHYNPDIKTEEAQIDEVKRADLKIFMTRWAQGKCRKSFKKSEYVPFGVDTARFMLGRRHEKRGFEVIFVSRIHYYKGVMPFLDSIPLTLKKCSDVTFRLHSLPDDFTPYRDEIIRSIENTKKRYPNNFFHDTSWKPYDRTEEIYSSSSVLVFPSNNEGFGIPPIEAMSCGIPCITSDVPPMNEIVSHETGFLLKQKQSKRYHGFAFPDPADIAEKIIYLRNNRAALEGMGRKGRAHVKKNYELKECVDRFVSVIKKEINEK